MRVKSRTRLMSGVGMATLIGATLVVGPMVGQASAADDPCNALRNGMRLGAIGASMAGQPELGGAMGALSYYPCPLPNAGINGPVTPGVQAVGGA